MAKGNNNRGDWRSKIRFIMLDADLGEGELDQVTPAIANALRPSTPVVQRLVTAGPSTSPSLRAAEIEEAEVIEDGEEKMAGEPVVRSKAPARDRKHPSPHVVPVDLESPVSFPDFAASKRPKSQPDRFTVVAAWIKLQRNQDAITTHDAYTCFIHPRVKWSVSTKDFDQPLRELKKRNQMGQGGEGPVRHQPDRHGRGGGDGNRAGRGIG
jgi:hypothetical protein